MDIAPKKEALKGIISVMKELKLEKMKGYKKAKDEEPSVEMEMHQLDKKKSDKLKQAIREKFKDMLKDKEDK